MKTLRIGLLVCLIFMSAVNVSFANNNEEKPFKIDIYGFVNYEMIFDTRQVVSAREGAVLLFPANEKLDADGNDINATPSFNFIVLSSRMGAKITGPDAFGAKTSAHFEGDLLGTKAGLNAVARLRHAYIRMKWEKSELMAGQNWHPIFVGACFPNTVSFAGGVPYYALNRSPQIKFAYDFGPLNVAAFLLSQNDFASLGPDGASSTYIRNSMQPEVYLQTIFKKEKFLIGATGGYQVITPRIETTTGHKTNQTMESIQANVFTTIQLPGVVVKLQAVYSENASHLVMLGGYGEAELLDADRAIYSYAGISSLSTWADFETKGPKIKGGLLIGYAQNLGAKEDITGATWARGANIDNMFRISPRVVYNSGKAQFGMEFVYDVADYGTPNARYEISNTKAISNLRTVLSLKYFF
jgi:hypothetical protein